MIMTPSGPMRDGTTATSVALLLRRYEADWRSSPGFRPDPREYLPDDPARRPAVLLALLRADLGLRWNTIEQCPIEWYRERYPELDGESIVALLYEEYSLREEAGESPRAAEYRARFPQFAESFQEVLEIHDLFGRAGSKGSRGPGSGATPLPEAGQTIAGFRLVEELGRGTFARVYLAEERHLADRLVALKVTRTGSREPQTLARLQHTHIVPVYSYLTDGVTGLHLLCMPFLGRITLLQVLNHPDFQTARTGLDLLKLLDRLQPVDLRITQRAASRLVLVHSTFAQAIAWWGARMAEALQHAHDRQVLHRDIKPSNVLISGDGLPMLLDFNLAQEPLRDQTGGAADTVAGTLAYMAPEQLDALARGGPNHVDARSDLYALGVVLFDCLVRGTKSFALPSKSMNMTEALLCTAELRRKYTLRLRATQPDVPPALEAIVRCCLAPDPADRYASAGQLAVDLQAVVDDGPLRFAYERLTSRCVRWGRRNRRRLAIAVPFILAIGAFAYYLGAAEIAAFRRAIDVRVWFSRGTHSSQEGRLEVARSQFATAAQLAQGDRRLRRLLGEITEADERARKTKEIRDQADELFRVGDRLRFSLLGFNGDVKAACRGAQAALSKFSVVDDPDWLERKPIALLDEPRRVRLKTEVNELLFLWVVASDGDPKAARESARLCDLALAFASPAGPWQALRERSKARLAGLATAPLTLANNADESTARGCFQWALLCDLDGRNEAVVAWLERATRIDPRDYWSHFYLGDYCRRIGQTGRAMEHLQAAVALRPDSPWARNNRALVYRERGDWEPALDDLNRALASPHGPELREAWLSLGLVKQDLGDEAGARQAYDSVIRAGSGTPFAAAARLNRAKLDIDSGAVQRAWAEYDSLVRDDPRDIPARLSRALLALRFGRPAQAAVDLTTLLRHDPERADEWLASRALAQLALGRLDSAEADAAGAYRRKPSPSRERLWARTLLALHRVEDLFWLDRPDDLTILPGGGPALLADLREAAKRLHALAEGDRSAAGIARAHRARAVILSALEDREAEPEASRAVALAPESADAYLVRAWVRRRSGNRRAAMADVESALALVPGDPRGLELRGTLKTEMGNAEGALIDLDRAILHSASARVRVPRALALMAVGRNEEAIREWSRALDDDPEDPEAYLGRARALFRLRRPDRALADLEQAAEWAADNAHLLPRITAAYAVCLTSRPDRFPRWLRLARRAWSAWIATARSSPGGKT